MTLSFRNVRNVALVLALLGLPVLLLRSSMQDPHELGAFDRAIRRIGAPLEHGIKYATGSLGSLFERWVLQGKLQDENEQLRKSNRELKQRVRELGHVDDENEQLRRSLQLRDKVPEDLVAAEILGPDQSPFFRVVKIRIDRGHKLVRPGMAVLSVDGVVGRVDRAFDDYSDVMLVTDPRSKIAIEIARTHAQGILEGATEDSCTAKVPKDIDVQRGDLVQTSGVDELFPKGHPVGQVVDVRDLVGDQKLVEVLPAVRFDRLDMVWVVLANAPAADPRAEHPVGGELAVGIQPVR